MMEYLEIGEIRERAAEITQSLDMLLSSRALSCRRGARQWCFLDDCMNRLLFSEFQSDFDEIPAVQAAQYKYEVEDRLRRYYQHPGNAVDFVFTLVHKSKLIIWEIDSDEYPALAGYCLLIRDLSVDQGKPTAEQSGGDLRLYLERVVTEAIDAEFSAYATLPEVKVEELTRWFCPESPALKEILNLLNRHQKRRWILSNLYNPSTKRLLNIKVKNVGQQEAVVNTMEYWYLRWWDDRKGSYVYSYRETNRQMYMLTMDGAEWKVFQNLRPQPRTSIPNRWNRRQK